MKKRNWMIKTLFILLFVIASVGLALSFFPYFFIPDTVAVTQVPWSETGYETPKAAIQFTFTSKIAFTTNYPIHAKVEIWLYRQNQNDTNIFVHIVNPPAQAFKYPLSDPPTAGLIEMPKTGYPRKGEIDLEFTSSGAYGFAIYSGESSYLGNMIVGYAAQDKDVIQISPAETRFSTEWIVRGIGISFIICAIGGFLGIIKKQNENMQEPKLRIEDIFPKKFKFDVSKENRCFIIAKVRNVGQSTAKGCWGCFESSQTIKKNYKLHWADTPYRKLRDSTQPVDIAPNETRDLDIAFSLGGYGENTDNAVTSSPTFLSESNVDLRGTFDPSRVQINYDAVNPPEGAWIATHLALLYSPDFPEDFLKPGEFRGIVRVSTGEASQGDEKEIIIVTTVKWTDLNVKIL